MRTEILHRDSWNISNRRIRSGNQPELQRRRRRNFCSRCSLALALAQLLVTESHTMARMQARQAVLALFVISVAYPASATIPSSFAQASIPFNSSLKTGSNDLSLDNPFVGKPIDPKGMSTQQPHVTYINETAAIITWVSSDAVTFNGTAVPTNVDNVTTSLSLYGANNGVNVTPLRKSNYTYIFDNTAATANAPGDTGCNVCIT